MKFILIFVLVAAFVAAPIFGWSAIPAYFDHSAVSAVAIGLICGALLAAAIVFASI